MPFLHCIAESTRTLPPLLPSLDGTVYPSSASQHYPLPSPSPSSPLSASPPSSLSPSSPHSPSFSVTSLRSVHSDRATSPPSSPRNFKRPKYSIGNIIFGGSVCAGPQHLLQGQAVLQETAESLDALRQEGQQRDTWAKNNASTYKEDKVNDSMEVEQSSIDIDVERVGCDSPRSERCSDYVSIKDNKNESESDSKLFVASTAAVSITPTTVSNGVWKTEAVSSSPKPSLVVLQSSQTSSAPSPISSSTGSNKVNFSISSAIAKNSNDSSEKGHKVTKESPDEKTPHSIQARIQSCTKLIQFDTIVSDPSKDSNSIEVNGESLPKQSNCDREDLPHFRQTDGDAFRSEGNPLLAASLTESVYESAAKLLFLGVKWARSIPSFMQVRCSRHTFKRA